MTRRRQPAPGLRAFAGVAACLAALALPGPALSQNGAPACTCPPALAQFNQALPRVAERIALGGPVTIVAIGSSSTAGAGASSSAASYPSRLEAALKSKFPGIAIIVRNRGVNGEEIRDMLARLDRSVIAEKPDLVLWQLGTNSVLRDHDVASHAALIADGVKRLKAAGADVVLIDPQFAPKVIVKPSTQPMLRLISAAAKQASVELFHRYAVMRYWYYEARIPFDRFVTPDRLHMNDWGYNCWAKLMADAIVGAVTRVPQTAHASTMRQ